MLFCPKNIYPWMEGDTMVCCLFGHGNAPDSVRQSLKNEILKIFEADTETMFYFGKHGRFDAMVRSVMKELKKECHDIHYAVVLSRMPGPLGEFDDPKEYEDTMFPEGLEEVHPKFGITWVNNWMVKQTDTVICYITHDFGGAVQFVRKARRKGARIINLADM